MDIFTVEMKSTLEDYPRTNMAEKEFKQDYAKSFSRQNFVTNA